MDNLDFPSFLRDKMKEHNMSLRRLSETTGISLEYLELLLKGNLENLPPVPYLRGYLSRIAETLEFEPEIWWEYFRQAELKSSGPRDALPRNRFAPQPVSKHIWWMVVVVVALAYFGFRFTAIFGKPVLLVENPLSDMIQTEESPIVLRGQMKYGDQVFINSESVPLENNSWRKEVPLQPGLNTFEIKATKFLGRETKTIRQIFYEPPLITTSTLSLESPTSTEPEELPRDASSTPE
ncbi:MAG: helix-turn-helix transcriptional regulator [Candidatus Liptonbacteria bacterium]